MGDSLLMGTAGHRRKTRTAGLLLGTLVIALLLLGFVLAVPAQAVHYTDTELAFVQLLNQYRVQNGLQPLQVSDMISEACDRHGSDMGKYKFFDHYTKASDWFASWSLSLGSHGCQWLQLQHLQGREHRGRLLRPPRPSSRAGRPHSGHNANMLSSNFKVLGVSLVVVVGSPYGSYWTTDFGGYVDSTAHERRVDLNYDHDDEGAHDYDPAAPHDDHGARRPRPPKRRPQRRGHLRRRPPPSRRRPPLRQPPRRPPLRRYPSPLRPPSPSPPRRRRRRRRRPKPASASHFSDVDETTLVRRGDQRTGGRRP